jgi:hypothetical protein
LKQQGGQLGSANGQRQGTITSTDEQTVWVLKADIVMIALLFDEGITSLTFGGLRHGLSHIELGTTVAAVPEPSTWAMIILGFGGGLHGVSPLAQRSWSRDRCALIEINPRIASRLWAAFSFWRDTVFKSLFRGGCEIIEPASAAARPKVPSLTPDLSPSRVE